MREIEIKICIAILVATTIALSSSPSSAVETIPPVQTAAEQTDAHKPVYPRPALHENREGWVLVDFDIDANGKVINAAVVEAVGGSIFETAATRSVSRWRYRPAEKDGRPVFQGRNSKYVVFALNENQRGSSQRFAARYNDILDLIDKNKLKRADALARSVFDEWPLTIYELNKLWTLRAELALIQNDARAAESALSKATANDGRWLDERAYQSLLLATVHIKVELGKYQSAMDTFRTLSELHPDRSEALSQTTQMIWSLHSIADSDQVLATDGIILKSEDCASCSPQWRFEPVRRAFTISHVDGELQSVSMICDNIRARRIFLRNTTWHLPAGSGSCQIQILGSPNTTFKVYQLAN